jgi:hypothetical protein
MAKSFKFDELSANAQECSIRLILETADIRLLLWPDGMIAEVHCSHHIRLEIPEESLNARHVTEIVEPEDRARLAAMVEQAKNGIQAAPAILHHSALIKSGTRARYSAHLAGDDKNIILLGRAQSLELNAAARIAIEHMGYERPE